ARDSFARPPPPVADLDRLATRGRQRAATCAAAMTAADTSGSSPADIDPVPAVIDAEAWEELSAGLIQRVRLLDALYADLYGPRTVFETDVAPTSELLADPSYLRPVTGMPRHGAHHL